MWMLRSKRMTRLAAISRTVALTAAMGFLVAGCSTIFKLEGLKGLLVREATLQSVSILAEKDVNGGYPLALDIVAVTDAAVLSTLAGMRANEWLAAKADIQRQHKGKLTVLSWELVPSQQFLDVKMPPAESSVVGVIVYADYFGERSYRASVKNQKKVVIRLRRDDFEVTPE